MRTTLGGELLTQLLDLYTQPYRKYAVFSGRSRRREYWTFVLVNIVLVGSLSWLDVRLGWYSTARGIGVLSTLFLLAMIVPFAAVTVRRLHDSGLSGAWILIQLVPVFGMLVSWLQLLRPSDPGSNRFGRGHRPQLVAELAADGGPPFASRRGRFIQCPWCGKSNPRGQQRCQWCHKPYREFEPDASPA